MKSRTAGKNVDKKTKSDIYVEYKTKEMSKTVGKSSPQTGKWESKEFRGISRAQKP